MAALPGLALLHGAFLRSPLGGIRRGLSALFARALPPPPAAARRAPLAAAPLAAAALAFSLPRAGRAGAAFISSVAPSAAAPPTCSPLDPAAVWAMNRNAREPRAANHGARPCSSVRRRRKYKTRVNPHPYIPASKQQKKKGYDY
jgi:hypothetical protein